MDYKGMRYRTFKKFIHPINMCNPIDHLDLDRQIKFINLIMHWNIRTAYYRGMVGWCFFFPVIFFFLRNSVLGSRFIDRNSLNRDPAMEKRGSRSADP